MQGRAREENARGAGSGTTWGGGIARRNKEGIQGATVIAGRGSGEETPKLYLQNLPASKRL